MGRIMAAALAEHVGERATIAGWIHHQRHLARPVVPAAARRERRGAGRGRRRVRARAHGRVASRDGGGDHRQRGRFGAGSGRRRAARAVGHGARRGDLRVAVRDAPSRAEGDAAVAARPRRGVPASSAHPRLRSRSRPPRSRASGRRSTVSASPRSRRRRSSEPRPRAAPTCSASTTSAARHISRRARSSTSRSWSACSSASTRPARCSVPNHTTPRAISRNTCRSTPSWASFTTTGTWKWCCATCSRAWSPRSKSRATGAVELLGLHLPNVPDEIPRIHFHDAQLMVQDRDG